MMGLPAIDGSVIDVSMGGLSGNRNLDDVSVNCGGARGLLL